ncbi:MAG: DUF4004 family protein [Lachnospiraceae bacterium]|nr:DUF4004 family protein [Lachnospiraceae bacterium]
MYITKKELLEQTGISYGQLYRWKREGLIPEEWFIKKPSKTGQETCLPQEQILERIAFIQKNKGLRSLDELAGMLSVPKGLKEFNKELLEQMSEIHPEITRAVTDGEYSRIEVAFLAIISNVYTKYRLTKGDMSGLLSGCADYFTDLPQGRHEFLVYRVFGKVFGMVAKEGADPLADNRIALMEKFQIEELANELAIKYIRGADV